ncbi:MAG TPA: hypothetical protein VGP41_05675 [Candidatus Lustribacter sp.]|nr:hypothetical protein [Candidatus Lustribacter sp.]
MSFNIGDAAAAAAASARDALTTASATANERTMGALAQQALFAEAMLGAVKARVDELKVVAK